MNLQRINIYRSVFILLLFVLTAIPVFEVHFLLYFVITVFLLLSKDYSISKTTFNILFLLSIIFLIGVFSSFFYHKTLFNWFKDILYFLKPIISILLGYLLIQKINNKTFFFKTIIYTSIVFAVYHIISVLINTDFSTDSINDIRNSNGLGNPLELFALLLLIGASRYDYLKVIYKNRKLLILILTISIILYFSRTMVVAFIIMLLSIYGYTKLTVKGFKYGMLLFVLTGLFYFYLFSVDIKRDQPGLESFLYKLKIAPSEIFSPGKEIDIKNHKNLWDHWRAYEAKMAYKQMKIKPISFLNGYGFGSLVDLKFIAPLNDKGMRYIPILHNGYFYILFKTGLLGLFVYFGFLILLYLQAYKKVLDTDLMAIRYFISAIGLYFVFTSLIITGIYNFEETYTFILGGFLFLLFKNTNNQLINNN